MRVGRSGIEIVTGNGVVGSEPEAFCSIADIGQSVGNRDIGAAG